MTKTQRLKLAALRKLPNYIPTKEEFKYYHYCVNNDIRISPIAVPNKNGEWYIGISDPSNHRKVYNSKFIYDKDTIWVEYYNMCKWYYDKH